MTDFLKEVGQTNKLLLIEEFNQSKPTLTDIMSELISKPNELVKKIKKELEIKSYDDFLRKFDPVIYQWNTKDINGKDIICYDCIPPRSGKYYAIHICEQEYYKSIRDLYIDKITRGETNLDTDYSIIANKLNPSNVIKQAKTVRKRLDSAYREYVALTEAKAAPVEIKARLDTIDRLRDEAANLYENNFIGILALAAGDYKEILLEMRKQLPSPKDNNIVSEKQLLKRGREIAGLVDEENPENLLEEGKERLTAELTNLENEVVSKNEVSKQVSNIAYRKTFDVYGNVSLIPYEESQSIGTMDPDAQKEKRISEDVTALIAVDFDEGVGEEFNDSEPIKKVVLQALTNGQFLPTMQLNEVENAYNNWSNMYKTCQEGLINAIQQMVQKLLDVKIFFDHAIPEGQKELSGQTSVIVANCSLNELMDGENRNNFEECVKHIGEEAKAEKVAFALIPGVVDKDFRTRVSSIPVEQLTITSRRVKKNEDEESFKNSAPTMNNLVAAVNILKKNKIMTFFNYTANEETGFNRFDMQKLETYMNNVKEKLDGEEYAVFAYPNFTVLPESFSAFTFDDITIYGVGQYVDAAYVAAALVVASQDPQYLKKAIHENGKVVEPGYPGVRIDLEEYSSEMITKMNCENLLKMSNDIKEKIRESAFGFCFASSGSNSIGGKSIKNSYVYKARTMGKDTGKTKYKPIYKVLTKDFVERYLKTFETVNKEVRRHFENSIVKAEWINNAIDNERIINNILRKDEDIKCENDGDILNIIIKFSSGNEEFSINMKEA